MLTESGSSLVRLSFILGECVYVFTVPLFAWVLAWSLVMG